jgi:hypothetical protein
MAGFQGICSSGLYRLTDRPVALKKGDLVELLRSDSVPGSVTTLESVVFSPCLYLDDLGNDAAWSGKLEINLKDYGREMAGDVGFGMAFLRPEGRDAAIEWRIPAAGTFLLSVNPNRGPSRAESIPLEVLLPDGKRKTLSLVGKSPRFGRAEWQDLGVLRQAQGVRLRLRAVQGGVACADLVRLVPLAESDLTGPGEKRWDSFTVQWEEPSAERPWLKSVKIVPAAGEPVEVTPLSAAEGQSATTRRQAGNLPHGVSVRVARQAIPVLDATDGSRLLAAAGGSFRVELANDYGLTLSAELLRREPFVWLRDLGIFACREGDFASKKPQLDALAAQVQAAGKQPFRSTSE